MSVSFNRYKNKGLSIVSAVLLVVGSSTFGLMSCGGGGSSTPPPVVNQDAGGLFKSGTAELDAGAVALNDLRAFVYDNRIMAFSISQHILFDGQVTAITGDDFTATVNLYEIGVMTQANIPVTGKVTSQSQVTGTLAGTGVGSGTFTLTYDMAYDTPASITKYIDQPLDWKGDLLATYSFVGDVGLDIVDADSSGIAIDVRDDGLTERCGFGGGYTVPDSTKNIYPLSVNVPDVAFNQANCTQFDINTTTYTGFSAVLSETGTDTEYLIAITDGNKSVFGLLVQQP